VARVPKQARAALRDWQCLSFFVSEGCCLRASTQNTQTHKERERGRAGNAKHGSTF
jgi:hypothetical protein